MALTKTTITGITTGSNYEEGSAYSLVNLRPKNGALFPVAPRKAEYTLSRKYDIIFIHQNNDYKNWLGVVNEEKSSTVYWDILGEKPKVIKSGLSAKINSIQQIGNTVSLITSDNIYYLFYQEENYIFLGEVPQVPLISLKSKDMNGHYESAFKAEYGSKAITPDLFLEATRGLAGKAINKVNEMYGLQLHDAHFVRYAFRLFDGTLTKHSPPILVMPQSGILGLKRVEYRFYKGQLQDESKVFIKGYRLQMNYDFKVIGKKEARTWKDIIKSVDVFISQPLGISSIENIRKDFYTENNPDWQVFPLNNAPTHEVLEKLANTSNFFFIKSIPLGGSTRSGNPEEIPSSDTVTKMENLIYQDTMSDDNFSAHHYGAKACFAYNNRLHLGNIRTVFFSGHDIGYFQWGGSYNGVERPKGTPNVHSIAIEVEIQAGASLKKVYSLYKTSLDPNPIYKAFASPFLSYPDPRARRITIYEVSDVWTAVFTAELKPHNMLNLAYYLNKELKPIVGNKINEIDKPDTEREVTLLEPNKIKVSELSNPMNFPNANTYQVGNGTILAMASNAVSISEGQFGQFPLYVFTTQGIYSLNVGQGDVAYSSQSAPTSYEVPTTPIVAPTPLGIVFTSARGICLIRGQRVELLTEQLKDNPRELNVEFRGPMEEAIHKFDVKPFAEYLSEVDNIVYNPHENELIIADKESDFNYVLNLDSQSFYQTTEKVDSVVGNTFPELYVVSDNKLLNYKYAEVNEDGTAERAKVSFILRPLKYGTPNIKWLEKMLLIGTLYDVNPLVYVSCSSMDGVNFKAMSGMAPKERGNYARLETQRIAGNKYTDFLFCFGATLSHKESIIHYLESLVNAQYNDNLMK